MKSVPSSEIATVKTETSKTRRANWTVTKDQILQPRKWPRFSWTSTSEQSGA